MSKRKRTKGQEKFEDTKGVIRSHESKKRTKGQEKFEDTKGVIRSHESKKDRQCNVQKEKDKRTQKKRFEDTKSGVILGAPVSRPATCDTNVVTLK